MSLNRSLRWVAITVFALGSAYVDDLAQPGAFGGGYGPPLKVVPPPKVFTTSDEHYAYLLAQAKGGTKHTIASVPRWDGLWVTAGNTHMDMFIDPPGFSGKVRPNVLTPPYEAAYKERWRQQQELGEVQYDRLTHCEPPGYPRWLLEPVLARVRQPAARVIPDQRLRAGDPPRLHRPGAQERVRHALLVRRHDRVLGPRSARHAHEVPAAGRLHALVADDEQSVRIGRNVGAQAVPWRHRLGSRCRSPSTTGTPSSDRSAPSMRFVRQRNSKRQAIASSIGSARRATTTSPTRARQRRGCRARPGSRTGAGPRSFRICRASRVTRSTTRRFRS